MNTQYQIQDAIRTLSSAFAPLDCHILAARNGSFSFTLVNSAGIAQHTQRLYPGQYTGQRLEKVIEQTKQSLVA